MSIRKLWRVSAVPAVMAAMWGCAGGGHSSSKGGGNPTMISGASFQVVWPARSRTALATGLTSALSFQVVLNAADAKGQDLTLKFGRDSTQVGGYTATYQVGQAIRASTSSISATFYANPAEAGQVVGTAGASLSFTGSAFNFAKIVLQGVIHSVGVVTPGTLTAGSPPTQLQFVTRDASGDSVAVTPGSAIWAVVSGSTYLSLTRDGIATPASAGGAVVTATVDGIVSPNATVTVGSTGAKGTYRMVVIPTSATPLYECGINSSGEVVATGYGTKGPYQAYSWTMAGGVQDLSLGASQLGISSSIGTAINDSGQMVGQGFAGSDSSSLPAFWPSSTAALAEPLQTFGYGKGSSLVWGINDSGAFVGGTNTTLANDTTPTYWASSTSKPVTMSQGSAAGAIAFGINASGEIAGEIQSLQTAGTPTHACVWSAYSAAPTLLKEVSGGTRSEAVALNSSGEILGSETESDGKMHILVWSSATATPQEIGSQPPAILALFTPSLLGSLNDSGAAVWLSIGGTFGGELYTPTGGSKDLTTLLDSSGAGYTVTSACGINNNGWIVGTAISGGVSSPVVLIPNP